MKERLSFVIQKEAEIRQEGTVRVPSACDQLSIYYDLSVKYTFLVFLRVLDPKGRVRFLKQLSYSEPVIRLGRTGQDTTIGGIPGPIEAGNWKLQVYMFSEHIAHLIGRSRISFTMLVTDDDALVTECVGENVWVNEDFYYTGYDYKKVYQREKRWYRGDLHTHTRLSDGKELPLTANEKSKKMGLDYYIPTEHNVLHTGWPSTDVMIVPGVEITSTQGHANLFGIDKMPENLEGILGNKEVIKLRADLHSIFREAEERGWLKSINHPFLHIWKWLDDTLELKMLDCLEIINDPTYAADPMAEAEIANQKAVLLSDLLWEDGYRICAIGGSDSHNREDEWYEGADGPSIPGDPATYLYMNKLSPENLLKALKNCYCYVTRHCRIESDLCFGGRLHRECDRMTYEIRFLDLKEEPVVFYLHNGQKHYCKVIAESENEFLVQGEIPLTKEPYQWIRFGAETQEGEFLFYGNPVTRGRKTHQYRTFGQIRKKLEERWK